MKILKTICQHKLFPSFVFVLILFSLIRFMPWDRVNWGKFEMLPGSAITVTGEAKNELKSQIARFTAGVTATNQDKQTAIDEVNQNMEQIIKAVKDFGISEADIQTQNLGVYQEEDQPRVLTYPAPPAVDQWRANNSIEIILRNVAQASDLADLLASLPTTDVSGPRFTLDNTQTAQPDLLQAAIDNAREKADTIAQASGRKLGKVLTVSEGSTVQPGPVFRALETDVATTAPVEPGTETVYKTVTVTFELK